MALNFKLPELNDIVEADSPAQHDSSADLDALKRKIVERERTTRESDKTPLSKEQDKIQSTLTKVKRQGNIAASEPPKKNKRAGMEVVIRPKGRREVIKFTRGDKAKKKKGGLNLTERDKLVLLYLSKVKFATVEQVRLLFPAEMDVRKREGSTNPDDLGITVLGAYKRMLRLEKFGCVIGKRVQGGPLLWFLTLKGGRQIGLTSRSVYQHKEFTSPAIVEHQLGIGTALALAVSDKFARVSPIPEYSLEVQLAVSEQELESSWAKFAHQLGLRRDDPQVVRAMDHAIERDGMEVVARKTPAAYMPYSGRGTHTFIHRPDLVIASPGREYAICIEVELSHKSDARYEKINRAYFDSIVKQDRLLQVVWLTHSPAIMRAIGRSVKAIAKENNLPANEVSKYIAIKPLLDPFGEVHKDTIWLKDRQR